MAQSPIGNVGGLVGPRSGIMQLDVDTHNDVDCPDQLRELEAKRGGCHAPEHIIVAVTGATISSGIRKSHYTTKFVGTPAISTALKASCKLLITSAVCYLVVLRHTLPRFSNFLRIRQDSV